MQVLQMTMCSARVEPACGKRAATAFVLDAGEQAIRLARCPEHAELLRAALKSLLADGVWREEALEAGR